MLLETVKSTLGTLDAQGEEEHSDWDARVTESLLNLENGYQQLRNEDRDLTDYSDLSTHAAYVFRYVIGHAAFTDDYLKRLQERLREPIFDEEILRVASIGGGPGSEFLGLVKYLHEEPSETSVTKIEYTIFDKEASWEHVAQELIDSTTGSIEINFNFVQLDLSTATVEDCDVLGGFDIVFLSYFVSEISKIPNLQKVKQNARALFTSMKQGAAMIYIDSDAYTFYSFMNEISNGILKQLDDQNIAFKLDTPNYDGIMDEYVQQFDYRPKLNSKAVVKTLKRN